MTDTLDWLKAAGAPDHVRPGNVVWRVQKHFSIQYPDGRCYAGLEADQITNLSVEVRWDSTRRIIYHASFDHACPRDAAECFATEAEARVALAAHYTEEDARLARNAVLEVASREQVNRERSLANSLQPG